MLEIKYLGDPVLRQRAAEVEEFDGDLRQLADEMLSTMYESEGIGLAAPQVGISQRMFVMDVREEGTEPRVVVNPEVVEAEGAERAEEGCLSLPGLIGEVQRAERIVMEASDVEGNRVTVEASGLEARCILHEIDHLDGVLFIDRVSPIKRKMLLSKWKKLKKEAAAG